MILYRNLFSISKAKIYLLSFILISFVIYIVYNYSLKQSVNELVKFEERFENIVKNLANQHKEDKNKHIDLEKKLSKEDGEMRYLENKLNEVPPGPEIAAGISRNDIEEAILDLSTKEKGKLKAPNYHFTKSWLNPKQPQWQRLITEFKGKEINVLEIGVFEGRSAIWILENLFDKPKSVLVALDTFKGNVDWYKGRNTRFIEESVLDQLEQTFIDNIEKSGFKKQVKIMKGMSYNSLIKLNYDEMQFDFIYIDGSHTANDVLADAILAWPLLKQNGIVIFDDYLLKSFKEEYNNANIAIDAFLACYAYEIELLDKNKQVAIRKVKRERSFTRM